MTGLFSCWQPIYAEYGIPTFPVVNAGGAKKPAIKGYLRMGLKGSLGFANDPRFAAADALGFALGARNGITVLDIDTPDERVLAHALEHHGRTPIIVRSGSGNWQAWYRHNGERRIIRPWGDDTPIDLLGGGYLVAPPSKGRVQEYSFVEGTLDDLVRLPVLRTEGYVQRENYGSFEKGRRNSALFRHCMQHAIHCDSLEALLDVARTCNESCMPPLADAEAVKTARSAWGYTERGENRFGRPGVYFDTTVVDHFIRTDQDGWILLSFLRAHNGPGRTFMVANGLANNLGWTVKRLAAARLRLTGTHMICVRGARQHNPALYRWLHQDGQN